MRTWLLTTSIYAADGLISSKQRDDLVSIPEAIRFAKADSQMLNLEYQEHSTISEKWPMIRVEISIAVSKE